MHFGLDVAEYPTLEEEDGTSLAPLRIGVGAQVKYLKGA